MQKPLFALLGGVLVMLLIACANVANLQIARAMERMEEMHVRSALGTSFARLLQQLVTESIVVSFSGALLGGALAYASTALIKTAYRNQYPRFDQLAMHPMVFISMALLALAVGILASLAPAFNVRRQTMTGVVAQRSTPRTRVSSTLVALQVALTCVLLVVCGLFVRRFLALQQVKLGSNPHHVTTPVVMPEDPHKSPIFFRLTDARLLQSFQALLGVESATLQSSVPFSNYGFFMSGVTDVSTRISTGTIVDATIVAAPSSTRNRRKERDPEMHQTRKGNPYYFGAKAHIGVDSKEGIVHSVCTSAASVSDVHMLPD